MFHVLEIDETEEASQLYESFFDIFKKFRAVLPRAQFLAARTRPLSKQLIGLVSVLSQGHYP